jgi:hypothetical protein
LRRCGFPVSERLYLKKNTTQLCRGQTYAV